MRLSIISFLFFTFPLYSQNIELISSDIQFPDVDENNESIIAASVYNPGSYPVEIIDIDIFKLYGDFPFTVSDTASALMPGDTFSFDIFFSPEHNIMHNMALVIKTNSGFGHVALEISGQGKYSMSYYDDTENKSEEDLKTALKSKLAQAYNSLGYTTARDNMYGSMDNHNGSVTCVYTGRNATFNTRSGANSNSFNCEHTFPQGFFNSSEPMRSDIHHLFPTDVAANSRRGNDPFGIVNSPVWQEGGSKSGGGKFEPRDEHKGSCARAMMYFVIRYRDYANHFAGQENILRSWHDQFPPDSSDVERNNAIAGLQNSRNPFIDYPQLAERITSFVSHSTAPTVEKPYFSDDTIRLLTASGRYDYGFVVYNEGSTAITLSDFSLSNPGLQFTADMEDPVTVLPGDAYTIDISYDAGEDYEAELIFNTNLNDFPTKIIPIRSGAKVGLEDLREEEVLNVFPNPSHGILHFNFPVEDLKRVWISNSTGLIRNLPLTQKQDLQHLPDGFYFLSVQTRENRTMMQKIILQ